MQENSLQKFQAQFENIFFNRKLALGILSDRNFASIDNYIMHTIELYLLSMTIK